MKRIDIKRDVKYKMIESLKSQIGEEIDEGESKPII
jgi:hypothetical protein